MKKIILLFFAVYYSSFAFDTIEVLNQNISLHNSGYFTTNKEFTPQEALTIAREGNLTKLPRKAVSFGFDKNTYWFIFEISTTGDEKLFLDSKNVVGDYQDLFVFDDEKLINTQNNGYFLPIDKRATKVLPIRFELQKSTKSLTYLVRVKSTNPQYAAFAFGNAEQLNSEWSIYYFIMVATAAMFVALTIYNVVLYIVTKDKAYIYYCIYVIGFFLLNFIALGYVSIIPNINTKYMYYLFLFVVLMKLTGLVQFVINFLNLNIESRSLSRNLLLLLGLSFLLAVFYLLKTWQPLFAISVQLLMLYSIYVGFRRYKDKFKPAMFFLIATGVSNSLFFAFMIMNQGEGIEFSVLSINLPNIALGWDLIVLSIALAYRIRLIQEEKEHTQRLIAQKAKFTVAGETIGNIAHQWRQPLGELGAIVTKLEAKSRYATLSKEELLGSIDRLNVVLKHLTDIITVFQNFFSKSQEEHIELNQTIENALTFISGVFNGYGISLVKHLEEDISLNANKDELFQVLLIVLNNAKDALLENRSETPMIIIKTHADQSQIYLSIEDNGGGIKHSNINEIFEPYFSTKGSNGMGIGLYTAKVIIEKKMGGKITVENTDNGAILKICLPING